MSDAARVIGARLQEVRTRIEAAGRDPEEVQVVGVTKGQPVEVAAAAQKAGLSRLGENRVQEALPKIKALPEIEWHLIGHLQTNKARLAAAAFHLVQSVDSERLVDALAASGHPPAVLVQVNVAREPGQHGVAPESALDLIAYAAERLRTLGLMAIGPRLNPEPAFLEVRRLRDASQERLGCSLPILSMGMSGDFEAALRAGSTLLRLGTVLFGPRRER